MSDVAGDWPELGEELAYKALDTLQDRLWEYTQGLLSREAVIAVCKSLMESISGLAPWSVYHLIYKVRRELEEDSP